MSWPWSWFANYEARMYKKMVALPPDLVIKLEIPAETALARKKDTPQEMVRLKVQAIRKLSFESQTKVVSIDAEVPLDRVNVDVKRAVWEVI